MKVQQLVVQFTITVDISRQPIVVDGEGFQPTIANIVIVGRQSATEIVVVQVQKSQFDKGIAQVLGESSGQLISTNIKVLQMSKSELFGDGARKFVGIDVEVDCQKINGRMESGNW